MIDVDVIGKSFGTSPVLGPIRFWIAAGETLALLGPSGIGKSTLLRLIAGVDTRFKGQIRRPDRLSFVFQEPTLLPWRSVLQNLTLIHPNLSHTAALEALDRVGLAGKDALFPAQLSLGQQRRLALARAFAGQPEVLLMDEPFASLDADTARAMVALTRSLIDQVLPATLLVTHDAKEAEALADRVLVLQVGPNGAVLADT